MAAQLELHLLRHGQTTSSRDDLFSGARAEPELTAAGREMAELFAAAYAPLKFAAIYCSPQGRARATAAPIAAKLGLMPVLEEGLREIEYGFWDGQTRAEVEKRYGQDYARWNADPASHAPTGGETAVAIADRAERVVKAIRERHPAGRVLLVSHKATIRVLLCRLLDIPLARYRDRLACPVGSLSVVTFGVKGALLRAIGDCVYQGERLRGLAGS